MPYFKLYKIKEENMHFFKIYETSVSKAIQQVHQFLAQCELRNWYDYTIIGTLDIGTDRFYHHGEGHPRVLKIFTNRADINKMLTEYVSVKKFNKKKELLLSFIMSEEWRYAESCCRDLAGIEYAMGREIDVADMNVPVINGDNVAVTGLSKIGVGPALASDEMTAYLVEVRFIF